MMDMTTKLGLLPQSGGFSRVFNIGVSMVLAEVTKEGVKATMYLYVSSSFPYPFLSLLSLLSALSLSQ